jgi:hypothetical protein
MNPLHRFPCPRGSESAPPQIGHRRSREKRCAPVTVIVRPPEVGALSRYCPSGTALVAPDRKSARRRVHPK